MQNLIPTNPLDNLTRIEYKGQPVLTTAQLAAALSTPDKVVTAINLVNNFKNNRERFVEGKHFFKLEGEEFKAFRDSIKNFYPIQAKSNLLLWTKRGVARHCKSVGTDIAWDVYEVLEENYFNSVEKVKPVVSVADFERATRMCKLASHSKDPYKREKLVAEAANLLFGREEFTVPPEPKRVEQLSLFYFK